MPVVDDEDVENLILHGVHHGTGTVCAAEWERRALAKHHALCTEVLLLFRIMQLNKINHVLNTIFLMVMQTTKSHF